MILLALALATAMSGCTPRCTGAARALCCERHAAYDKGDNARVFALIEDEVAVVQAERSTRAGPLGAGSLQPLCDPIEAGFNLCNEWLPERGCASQGSGCGATGSLTIHATSGCGSTASQ